MQTILIADDDVDIRRILETSLAHHGFNVLACSGGEQVPEMAAAQRPDLIILDIEMPRVDGYQVLWHLKNQVETRNIPAIVLSGRKDEGSVDYGKKLGACEYMFKPFSPSDLLDRVDRLLGQNAMSDAQVH